MNAALDVACYIIEKSRYTKTHLQVQKLVYISQRVLCLQYMTGRCSMMMWRRGATGLPYRQYMGHLSGGEAVLLVIQQQSPSPCTPPPSPPPKQFDDEERKVIDSVYENYGKFSGYHLSDITRNAGGELDTPWTQCYESGGENTVIGNGLIKQYYKFLFNVDV